jgi:hypothetical protein
MPLMADALAAGVVTEGHARALGRCLTPRTLEAFARDEAMLVAKAATVEVDDYEITIGEWLRRNDVDGPDPGGGKPSELHTSPMLYGRTRIDGELELEDSAEFLAELDQLYDEQWHVEQAADLDDPIRMRSHAERNAAALVEMARRSSAAGDRDSDDDTGTVRARPRRPQLLTIVDVPALAGDPNGRAELEDGRLLPLSVLERWACDCSLGRVVMAGRSIPIDLGQVTYTPSAGQRRALIARDRGCIVPGCKRKARWCEAHHVDHWPHGPTNLSNLVLLCGRHHKQVHNKRITLVKNPTGHWEVRRPDGTPLLQRPPPTLAA